MARANVVVGAVLLVVGAAAGGYAASHRPSTSRESPNVQKLLDEAVSGIDQKLNVSFGTVNGRAELIAGQTTVSSAIATNADTVKNLSNEDLQFKPSGLERVELGQITKQNGKDVAQLLRSFPDGGSPSPHLAENGTFLTVVDGHAAYVSAVRPVLLEGQTANDAKARGIERGAVVVSWQMDLGQELEPLKKFGVMLTTPDGSMAIGPAAPKDGKQLEKSLRSFPTAKLIINLPAASVGGSNGLLVGIGGALAALGLLLIVVGAVGGKKAVVTNETKRDSIPDAPVLPLGTDATALGPNSTPGLRARVPTMNAGTGQTGGSSSSGLSPDASAALAAQGGTILGRYQLVKRLGTGGMAEVYLARAHGEAGFAKQVALKVMHPHMSRRNEAVTHFLDEARLASSLSHPNIVQIIDLGKVDDDYFIAMEYIDGSDLERVLANMRAGKRPMPIAIAFGILRRVCDALQAAHTAVAADGTPLNLVHRDVKSANVMISRQGQVKLTDFGIAKAATQVHVTELGETKGTPSMMAPEQRMGKVVDGRADVYSTAAVGYEMFTGQVVNLDLAASLHRGIVGWPHLAPPTQVRADLPAELDELLLGALAFEPEARPESSDALEDKLAAIVTKHNLVVDEKAIARWIESELALLPDESALGISATQSA